MQITNYLDVIDSRDIIERIKELQLTQDDNNDDETEELEHLLKIEEECENYSDWEYGKTLIRESYWEEHVKELVTDCGHISKDFPWWIEIDWTETANNVAQDYTTVDFDGIDYYIRYC